MAKMHYKVIRFSAQNIKRVEQVEISPTGDLITVGGANAAGKSSRDIDTSNVVPVRHCY